MLNEQHRAVIRATIPALQLHGEAITTCFYGKMFQENPGLLDIFNKANQREGGQARNLATSILLYAAHIDHLDQLGPMVERIAHKHGSMEVLPEHYPIVGRNLLAAIQTVLGEAATPEIMEAWGAAYAQLADILIGREAELYDEGAAQAGGWRGFKPFRVIRRTPESSNMVSFYLAPEDGRPLPAFVPGQYLSIQLRVPGNPHGQIRQYSLSCAPNEKHYRISTGREPGGVVSNYLHDGVREGDSLSIHMPLGDFVLDIQGTGPVVLLSGGTGITPMMSMLEYLAQHSRRNVTFLHGAKNREQHAFGAAIRELTGKHAHCKAVFFYDQVGETDIPGQHHDEAGFIDAAGLRKHVANLDADFYLCGPVPFLRSVEKVLAELAIPAARQHSEAFTPDPNYLNERE